MSRDIDVDLALLELKIASTSETTLYQNLFHTAAALLININNRPYIETRDKEIRPLLYELLGVLKSYD